MAFLGFKLGGSLLFANSGATVKRALCPPASLARLQVAFISGKQLRDKSISKPPPFPYLEKRFGRFRALFDNTIKRFDENTKLVVVEGNIACGKSSFAKALAEDLDMFYLPEANLDSYYINEYGYDMRQLDSQLPEKVQSWDVKKFYQNPTHDNTSRFQILMYQQRFMQYVDALAHIMNTGQGVVLERCVYSDYVFLEAMHKFKYISEKVKNYYHDVKKNSITELMRPHLVIYLDVPVNILQERIKKRGIDYEVKSKVLTKEYLSEVEEQYKHYLKEISKHAELLVYDWSNYGDVEVVVEDVERIDFDRFDKYDSKLTDWRHMEREDWIDKRYLYTTDRNWLTSYFNIPMFDVPELTCTSEDTGIWETVWYNAPGKKFEKGYNMDMGDTGIFFKTKVPVRRRWR